MKVGSQLVGVCSLSTLRVCGVGLVSSGLAAGPSAYHPSFVSLRQSHYIPCCPGTFNHPPAYLSGVEIWGV